MTRLSTFAKAAETGGFSTAAPSRGTAAPSRGRSSIPERAVVAGSAAMTWIANVLIALFVLSALLDVGLTIARAPIG